MLTAHDGCPWLPQQVACMVVKRLHVLNFMGCGELRTWCMDLLVCLKTSAHDEAAPAGRLWICSGRAPAQADMHSLCLPL